MVTIGLAGCDAAGAAAGGGAAALLDDLAGGGGGGTDGEDDDDGGGGGGGEEAGGEGDPIEITVFATNTGTDASGIALRPSDQALFLLSADGLFGPIVEGTDVSQLGPIGAENIFDDDLFDNDTIGFKLAISEAGEFWIGSICCSALAVVPSGGGDAEQVLALLQDGVDVSNINPETMAFVPDGFDGPQMHPGNLLVGEEAGQSDLGAIDVEGDRAVVTVDKPTDAETGEVISRFANHLAFGPDGRLYGSRQVSSALIAGIQTIDTDGFPTDLPGTVGLAASSFVVLADDSLLIRGVYDPDPGNVAQVSGILLWDATTQAVVLFEDLPDEDMSGNDELIISDDRSTIFLSLPSRSEIWRGDDNR
jgi:hypothetical protein